jgi:hypothetical protein
MANCADILEETRNKVLNDASMRAGILQDNEPGLVNLQGVDALDVLREEVFSNMLNEFVSSKSFSAILTSF